MEKPTFILGDVARCFGHAQASECVTCARRMQIVYDNPDGHYVYTEPVINLHTADAKILAAERDALEDAKDVLFRRERVKV